MKSYPKRSRRLLPAALLLGLPATLQAVPFSTPTAVWSGEHNYRTLLVADINKDTLPDLAVVAGGTNLTWLVNTGAGNFTASSSLGVAGWNIGAAQAGDIDADGDADVVLVLRKNGDWYGNGQMAVFRNNGASGFTNVQQFASGGFPAYEDPNPVITDLDNDGDLDVGYIYCPDLGQGILAWRANNGSGVLGDAVTLEISTNNGDLYWADSMEAGDVNGDGRTDLVVTSQQNGTSGNIQSVIRTSLGINSGTFSAPLRVLVPSGKAGNSFLSDLNRDGRPDLVTMDKALSNEVLVRFNSGSGFGAVTQLASTSGNFSEDSSAGDLDNDGDNDIVISEIVDGINQLKWLRNNGAGQFQAPALLTGGLNSPGRVTRTLDADGDGDSDIAVLTQDGLAIALNQSIHRTVEPAFTSVTRASVLNGEPRLITADFDRDGETDVAVLSPYDGTVRWMPSNGSSLGAEITVSTAAAGASAFAAGDVTGDGLPDIVIGMPALGQIHLLRNVGNGSSWQTSLLPSLASVHAITIADGDADGALDVIAFSRTTYKTALFRNVNRDGTSWTQEQVSNQSAVDRIQAVQLVKPGRPEFLLTTYDPEVGICQLYRALWSGSTWNTSLLAQGNGGSSVVLASDLNGDGSSDLLRSLGYGAGWQPNYNNGSLNPAQSLAAFPVDGPRSGVLADLNGDGRSDFITAGAGQVLAALNMGNGSFAAPLTLFSTGAGEAFRDVVAFDFERDGDLDIAIAEAGADCVRILLNRGGQYDTVSTAPQSGQTAWGAEEKNLIRTTVSHQGAPQDASLGVKNFLVRLQRAVPQGNAGFSYGTGLTPAEATALLEKLDIYRDLGTAGTYEPGTDVLVASETSFASLANDGYFVAATLAGVQPQVQCGPGQSMNFLVRARARATAGNSPVDFIAASLILQAGGSLIVHQGSTPDWALRKRGAAGDISAVLGFVAPTALQSWRLANFGMHLNTGEATNDADPDKDGVPNLIEYVRGSNPKAASTNSEPAGLTITGQGPSNFLLANVSLINSYDSKVRLTLQTSTDLKTWSPFVVRTGTGPWSTSPISTTQSAGQTRFIFNTAAFPVLTPRFYLRLTAVELP
jgi:hypothetical protein